MFKLLFFFIIKLYFRNDIFKFLLIWGCLFSFFGGSYYKVFIDCYTLDVIYETCIDVCQNTNLFSKEFNLCRHFVIFLFLLFITIVLPFLIMKYASSVWSCTFIIIYIFSPLDFLVLVYFLGLFIYLDLINKHFKVPFTF